MPSLQKVNVVGPRYLVPASRTTYLNTTNRIGRTFVSTITTVDDFGAVPDGETDSTAAFAAAIAAGDVFMIAGDYVVDVLTIPADRKVVAFGSVRVGQIMNASGPMFNVTSGASVEFRNVVLDGDKANQATPRDIITLTSCGNLVVDGCTLTNASGRSIGGAVANTAKITNSTFTHSRDYPIQISGADDMLCEGNTIIFLASDTPANSNVRAIQPTDVTNFRAIGNQINTGRKYRDGIWMAECSVATISGNTIEETQDDQVSFAGATDSVAVTGNTLRGSNTTGGVVFLFPGEGQAHREITITGNVMEDGIAAIYVFSASRLVVSGNTIRSFTDAVRLASAAPSSDVVVADNVISDIISIGVDCGTSTRTKVASNVIQGAVGAIAVHGRTSTDGEVTDNVISGFSQGIQTGVGKWTVNDNRIIGGLGVKSANGAVPVSISGNQLEMVVPGIQLVAGTGRAVIDANVIRGHGSNVGGSRGIINGSAVDSIITNNSIFDFERPFECSSSSNRIIYTNNNHSGCAFGPVTSPAPIKIDNNNIGPPSI
jgi:hypothetical protein